ncbi:response regulator receiver [Sinomonas atrocyanea]|uniref:Response regulator receiver n=1 Tax=Sinomonas atrocyanea TaxID=37927 RepID=A0A127A7W5_9MICC|nr:GAF and ANTAR domain-containing protein [Sinomonas atrocyanea]AMM34715.1 response regulator receiver [Sinomonas atrocyanea]GEB64067.1 RNA-binding protein [Sinomonas atrocyanea]GGG67777.1 RNA-binding protein [Sinomonas atrocyanea]
MTAENIEMRPGVARQLQEALLQSDGLQAFLGQLAETTAERLASRGADCCSVTLQRCRRGATIASSHPEASRWDELQFAADDGPCLEAARTGVAVCSADLWSEQRWRGFVSQIRGHGPRSLMAAPIPLGVGAHAALTCYSIRRDAFEATDREELSAVASEASIAVQIALRLAAESELSSDLMAALDSRTAINLALGIIMGQSRCTQREAKEILVQASNHRNRKLREVALEVVSICDPDTPSTGFQCA